ncbi:hypothetical protein CLOM_g9383 [Closterium sp. NIES-68]|nr:hypothetical protein CLOM_g9383 [Closterium sp. NIES-68]
MAEEKAGSGFYADIVDGDVYKYFAHGEWKSSSSGRSVNIINPCTRTVVYRVQGCTQDEVDGVFESATIAQKRWAKTPLWKRAELLHKAAHILREHKEPIVDCLVTEVAKARKDSITEVLRSADFVSYCAEEGVRLLAEGKFLVGDSFPGNDRTKLCMASKVPLGVVLCIPPFNTPSTLLSPRSPRPDRWQCRRAQAPHSGRGGRAAHGAVLPGGGVPKGLISAVTGKGSDIGTSSPCTPLSTASASQAATRALPSAAGGHDSTTDELGGKDACIVLGGR